MNKSVYGDISFKLNWQGEIVAIQPRTRVVNGVRHLINTDMGISP